MHCQPWNPDSRRACIAIAAGKGKSVQQPQTCGTRHERIAHVLALLLQVLHEHAGIDAQVDPGAWCQQRSELESGAADAIQLRHRIERAARGDDAAREVQILDCSKGHDDRAHAVAPDEHRQRRESRLHARADRTQVARELGEVRYMSARPGIFAMSALVIDETGDVLCGQGRRDVPVAGAMLGDAMHDDETGARAVRQRLVTGKLCSDHAPISAVGLGCTLVSSQMPVSTSTVPMATHRVKGSPRKITAINMVESGPMVPACEVKEAPIFSIASMTMITGAKVQRVAFSTESHTTSAGTAKALSGLSSRNCAMQMRHATGVANPVS